MLNAITIPILYMKNKKDSNKLWKTLKSAMSSRKKNCNKLTMALLLKLRTYLMFFLIILVRLLQRSEKVLLPLWFIATHLKTHSEASFCFTAELVSFIKENEEKGTFLLSKRTKLYSDRLKELGTDTPERINSTRLKERILSLIPNLKEHNDGKAVQLTFDHNINAAVKLASSMNFDSEAIHLARTASILRRDLFKAQPQFNGSFEHNCQLRSVPSSLLALVTMILEGPSIKTEKDEEEDKSTSSAALTISQLLIFNATNRKRENKASPRHSVKQETPLPLYIGSVIHAETRKKQIVDRFYRLGLFVSYDRVMQVSTDLGNAVCTRY